MTRRFFSGTSVEQAVLLAARHYGLDPEEVAYTEMGKRHGFLRVRRKVIVEVNPDKPRRDRAAEGASATSVDAASPGGRAPGSPEPVEVGPARTTDATTETPREAVVPGARPQKATEPSPGGVDTRATADDGQAGRPISGAEDRPIADRPGDDRVAADRREPGSHLVGLPERPRTVAERFPAAEGATALAAEKAAKVALELLDMEAEIDVRQGEGQLEIELITEDKDRLLDEDGRVLGAIQHLLPRLVRGFIGEGASCRVDCDNFHQIHEERLRDLAQRVANEVKQQEGSQMLKPMTPRERRIVHLTLADDPAVGTDSVGDGFHKRVRIRPA